MISKEIWLSKLFYEVGKQIYDFELQILELEGKRTKRYKYSQICFNVENEKNRLFLSRCNQRQILPNEIVLDFEEEGKLQPAIEELQAAGIKFYVFSTGSRGYHIHIFFDRAISEEEKFKVIKYFDADTQLASNRHMIALEFTQHWKSGKIKDLVNAVESFEEIEKNSPESLLKKAAEPPKEIMKILQNPDLFNEITEKEFNKRIVGEIETRKVIFLCGAGGRLIENSQIASYNLLVNDEAGAGKDYVTDAVLDILPKGVYIHKTRITPTVFTYWHNSTYEPEWSWDGKVFYPEDISEQVLNSDVFRVMCSKGSSATIIIKQKAHEIDIKGKPVIITTTASATPNPELTRRLAILNLDSSEDQTKAIMKRHSEFKKIGVVPEYEEKYKEAMAYLRRVKVKITFADLIDKYFPTKNMIMRTHYPRFLDYIAASAGFYQYQRKIDNEGYVLAEGQDYDIARGCFLKLCSNKYMIPLTINQKKILKVFEKEPHLKAAASNLHSTKMNFISLPALQTNLGLLVKYGILETGTERDSLNREIEVYSLSKSYNPNEKLEIPTFEKLMQNNLNVLTNFTNLNNLNNFNITNQEGVIKDTKDIKPEKCLSDSATDNIDFSELDKEFENG